MKLGHDQLYMYEGCSKHGVKIGVSRKNRLGGRLTWARRRCPASDKFAKVWELANAYEIEQTVICILSMSDRNARPGEEWFHASCAEMIDAVGFALLGIIPWTHVR